MLLQLCTCLQVAHGFSPCFIDDTKAFCGLKRLNQVPRLPNYITFLDLNLNYISEINEKSFSGLEALQILEIEQQETQLVLKNNAFKGLSNLRELNLGFNRLLQLEPGAFNGLFNLQTLNLIQCSLNDSILSGDYIKPLVSLERLTLDTNSIKRIQPADFFFNMTEFHELDLSHNWIKSICEEDLFGFQGKHFTFLKLSDIKLTDMSHFWPKWNQCGNPFKNMSITVLDLSLNSFYVDMAVLFFKAIRGTKIHKLILSQSSSMGRSVGYNNMKDPDKDTFKDLADSGIRIFDLSQCHIFALTYSVFGHLSELEEALSTLSTIKLDGNRFLCDCSLRNLQTWLNQSQKKTNIEGNVEDLTCEFPEEQHGVPLIYSVLCEDMDDKETVENLRFVLFNCCTVFILLILTCAVIFVRLRGYCFKLYRKVIITFVEGSSKTPANDSFLYDVYLCFSSKDTGWVEKALLKKLDTQFSEKNNFRCCFEARDFLPGEDHLSNMRNAVWNSKKVLCIVSHEFLKDGWCLEAFTLAQSKMLEEVKDVLLVLLVDKIPQYRLMKYEPLRTYIQTRKYMRWPEDSQDLEWFYNQIKQSILKGTKGKHVKNTETNHNVPHIEAVTAL
ncbi:hypothetical protein AOLI_G00170670 [Acnodon oligacanthus]